MQNHHWHVLIGAVLALAGFPLYGPVHGAGLGVAIAGLINWWLSGGAQTPQK